MTREELVRIIGGSEVAALEAVDCEPTSRAYDRSLIGDEWMASYETKDLEGNPCRVEVYYYTDEDDDKIAEESGDWGMVTFTPHHYEIL